MKIEILIRALDRFSEFTYDEVVNMYIWEYEEKDAIINRVIPQQTKKVKK